MSAQQHFNLYKTEVSSELNRILDYWLRYTQDDVNGGIIGRIDHENNIFPEAPKGAVLHARVLWAFSAAYNLNGNTDYLAMASRTFDYLVSKFIDEQYGGVYWMVDHNGVPLDTKKQVYATAFVIYAFSEYYKASTNERAKQEAIDLYKILVEKSYDIEHTGYLEAFTRDWQSIDDLRLSAKDANEKKTMNTHLHVLEAYGNLYRIWPDAGLKTQVQTLLNNFTDHFIDKQTGHLSLFFDEGWNKSLNIISYGHDIEASWLLLEAAEIIGDEELITVFKKLAIVMADATLEGLDNDHGLWYEYDADKHGLVKEKHWWVQAEAMVGFYNAWQVSSDVKYAELSTQVWHFVKQHILDIEKGEWVWGITADGKLMPGEDKVGIWKCPYHNSRACIEIINRISQAV
ncbi:cellobiose 2-epimerase [Mucilaginibacter gynuensis]|uniref:Cellobiose 2-epimerase n=1 Tax=Mucilaginibacter gynuensis TaxID=1302236 RepID=A0ABP8GEY1_9SPHI